MHTSLKADRGRLITISVAALFAMLVMSAASIDAIEGQTGYSLSRVSKLAAGKLVSAKLAAARTGLAAPTRAAASRIQSVASSLRQAASDYDYALLTVWLMLAVTIVVFSWQVSSPDLIPIPVRHNGPRSSRAPPSF
ncbi:MAG: hypothetical protein ABI823_05705 [Bryobacteraceae bacterium]